MTHGLHKQANISPMGAEMVVGMKLPYMAGAAMVNIG
jgi:hypothetical protein